MDLDGDGSCLTAIAASRDPALNNNGAKWNCLGYSRRRCEQIMTLKSLDCARRSELQLPETRVKTKIFIEY